MKKNLLSLIALPLFCVCLTSCTIFDIVSKNSETTSFTGTKTEVEKAGAPNLVYKDIFLHADSGKGAIPSQGDVNLLVFPVEFSTHPFSSDDLNEISAAFSVNGEDTHYWESVPSFYSKSSFGALNMSATIAPKHVMNMSPTEFISPIETENSGVLKIRDLFVSCVNEYKKTQDSMAKFDLDKDGRLDGVYIVYSCPTYVTDSSLHENFWAFSFQAGSTANVNDPQLANVVWASKSFLHFNWEMNRDKPSRPKGAVDAHCLIHETGHMLGLDDYYNYDSLLDKSDSSYSLYAPAGGVDMMDNNVVDHNMFSKYAMGWGNPYVVDNSYSYPITLDLKPSQLAGEFLIIPANGTSFNNNAFAEYLMVEFYTPTGLNKNDSDSALAGYYPKGFSKPGIKISHVDARMIDITPTSNGASTTGFKDVVTKTQINSGNSKKYYDLGNANTPSQSFGVEILSKNNVLLYHLLESSGVNTLKNGADATDSSLFTTKTGSNTFNTTKFKNFFAFSTASKGLFNSGKDFGYEIKVEAITAESATITISRA